MNTITHRMSGGGAAEGQKFDGMYSHSQALHEQYFGENLPADIWQPNAEHFSDIDFERINRRTNWIAPKPDWARNKAVWLGIGIFTVVGLFIQAQGSTVVALLAGLGVFTLLIYGLMSIDLSSERWEKRSGGTDGGCGTTYMDGSSDGGHHGSNGGHGDGGSGCSASGCSSGCSGCTGG